MYSPFDDCLDVISIPPFDHDFFDSDLNVKVVDPLLTPVKFVPWYTPGSLEVSQEDF